MGTHQIKEKRTHKEAGTAIIMRKIMYIMDKIMNKIMDHFTVII